MRRLILLACGLAATASLAAAPLTVVTWNTRWLPGGHPNASEREKAEQMRREQAIVKALNPDILLLQEVADWKAAAELCSVVPGLTVRTVSNFSTRPQNLVIASRLPVDSSWYAEWKPTLGPDLPPRGYAFAAIRLPDGTFLLTYSVHLKSNLGGIEPNIPIREEAVKQLLVHAKDMTALYAPRGKTALIIGGDFNSDSDDPRYGNDHSVGLLRDAGLTWVFRDVPRTQRITIPASREFPDGTFDQMFFRGLKLQGVKVGNAAGSSDHNPVAAVFQP
jgi:endonuclease/exonuclease/phosphatase family metal-dependent hydrolase